MKKEYKTNFAEIKEFKRAGGVVIGVCVTPTGLEPTLQRAAGPESSRAKPGRAEPGASVSTSASRSDG